jgi:4-carboxymuconolactone decarboxylase
VKAVVGEPGLAAISSVSQVAPEMEQWIVAFGFGDVYSRPALPPRDRQLLTMATLTALGGCEPQLKLHIKAALNVGVTPAEVVETLMHAAGYCGFPRSLNALGVAREVFDELGVVPPKG